MKILILVNRIPFPLTDGGNIATWNLAKALEKQGHQISLACLNTQKHHQDPAVLQGHFHRTETVNIDTDLHLTSAFLNLFSPIPYIAERFISTEFKNLLIRMIQAEDYDIIQAEGLYMCAYFETVRKYSEAPFILRAHNVEYKIWERLAYNTSNLIKRLYLQGMYRSLKKYEAEIFSAMDGILFFTREDQCWASELNYSGKSVIIPAGVDTEKFQYTGIEKIPASIGFLGSLDWMPNQDAIIWFIREIFPKIRQEIPSAQFFIAGKNMPAQLLQDLDMKGVIVKGQVPDAAAYLHQLEIFIVPLRSGGGMRLKILEAMAASSCILSTSIGAEGIEGIHAEHFFIADTASEFASTAIYLLKNPEIRRSVSEKTYVQAKTHYAWDNIALRTLEFYSSLT